MEDKRSIKFSDLEQRLLVALRERGPALGLTPEPLNVVGMANILLQDDLGTLRIGGKSVPVVVVIGRNSGRVYQFAIRALLPDVEL